MIERIASEAHAETALRLAGLRPQPWSASPGTVFTPHQHDRAKRLYVVTGSINFRADATGDDVRLDPGEGIRIPARVEHTAVVGEDGVQCVEGFEEEPR